MRNRFLLDASVKALDSADPRGSFEAIVSTENLDRDGEVVEKGAFNPLPASVPVHVFHDFTQPVGRGVPSYEGDVLILRGTFASTDRAQEVRQLVTDGVIQHMSVGFMPPERKMVEDVPHIVKAELLEVSFTSVPSNREAAVLAAKTLAQRVEKAIAGSFEAQMQSLNAAVRELLPDAWWTWVVGTFPDKVVFEVEGSSGSLTYQSSYTIGDDGAITLSAPVPVVVEESIRPVTDEADKATATDPEFKAAAQAAALPPADVPVDRAQAALGLLDALTH